MIVFHRLYGKFVQPDSEHVQKLHAHIQKLQAENMELRRQNNQLQYEKSFINLDSRDSSMVVLSFSIMLFMSFMSSSLLRVYDSNCVFISS
jgi:type II secretory pathway component PulM